MEKLVAFCALIYCQGVSISTAVQLTAHFKCELADIPALPASVLVAQGLSNTQIEQLKGDYQNHAQRIKKWLQDPCQFPRQILFCDEGDYPQYLSHLHDKPLLLFVEGNVALLNLPQIAIVGARQATQHGKEYAFDFAKQLATNQWVITSGLAQGIDAQAHRGALAASGGTVAVLGHGHEHMYPRHHANLRQEILTQHGCIVSEFFPHQSARPKNFPRRNRIISGLSTGTLVVEAKRKSGSLITANQALHENRTVFALPGRIDDPNISGCLALIKEGAVMVQCVDDIESEMIALEKPKHHPISHSSMNKTEEDLSPSNLLDSVGYETTAIEVIAAHSSLPLPKLLARLLEFELSGKVAAVAGGYIKLRSDN
ncbi:MAG: DNA processing protein DprA [Glaciecola sp. HTCC2999]|nr:MAG: DNA processing protein DprA [Glaciecola sp. HTCC2999]